MTVRAQEGCSPDDEACLSEDQVGSFLLRTTADGKLYLNYSADSANKFEAKAADHIKSADLNWEKLN